jgi:hypothetical protein
MPKGPQGWTLAWRVLVGFGSIILILAAIVVVRVFPLPVRTPALLVIFAAFIARAVYVQMWIRRAKRNRNA